MSPEIVEKYCSNIVAQVGLEEATVQAKSNTEEESTAREDVSTQEEVTAQAESNAQEKSTALEESKHQEESNAHVESNAGEEQEESNAQ